MSAAKWPRSSSIFQTHLMKLIRWSQFFLFEYSEYFKCFIWIYDVCTNMRKTHFTTWQWKVPSAETQFFVKFQWRISRNFKTGERGRILRSGVCFDHAPSHIRYIFVVRVVNKIHIVNIVCWLKSRVIVKIYKNKLQTFFKPGGGGGAPVMCPFNWFHSQNENLKP